MRKTNYVKTDQKELNDFVNVKKHRYLFTKNSFVMA